jgi:hypothetical protein
MIAARIGGRWLFVEYRDPEDQVELESLGRRLRLADIYERVALPATPGPATPGEGR